MKSECIAFVRAPEQYCQNASKQQWTAFIDEARQYALLGVVIFLLRITMSGRESLLLYRITWSLVIITQKSKKSRY